MLPPRSCHGLDLGDRRAGALELSAEFGVLQLTVEQAAVSTGVERGRGCHLRFLRSGPRQPAALIRHRWRVETDSRFNSSNITSCQICSEDFRIPAVI